MSSLLVAPLKVLFFNFLLLDRRNHLFRACAGVLASHMCQ